MRNVRTSRKRFRHPHMAFALTLVLLASPGMSLEPLAKRIAHTDPSKYSREPHVHGRAGEMFFEELFNASAFETNLLFCIAACFRPNQASDIKLTSKPQRITSVAGIGAEICSPSR